MVVGSIRFRHNHDIYWEIEFDTNSYDNFSQSLAVKVSNYYPSNIAGFNDQKLKGTIQKLNFKGISWLELEKHLTSYKKKPLLLHGAVIETPEQNTTKQTNFSSPHATYAEALSFL